MPVDIDLKAAQKIRLPWWGMLGVIVGSYIVGSVFDEDFGRFDLALPTLYAVGVIGFAIAAAWTLRRRVWFWVTMAVTVAVHAVVIVSVHWTTKWMPAVVLAPFAAADLYLVLRTVSLVGRYVERSEAATDDPR